MKYFTRKALNEDFKRTVGAYQKQLAKLKGRVSQQAWNFFAFGNCGWGLHDARLLALSVGDGLDHSVSKRNQFEVNKQRAKARIQILNRKQTFVYSFICTDIKRMTFKYSAPDFRRIELLDTYELTAVDEHYLSLEFLFSSNATLLIEFGRLKFKRQRVSER